MSRYNIYKIKDGQVGALHEHLRIKRFTIATSFVSHGYNIYPYFAGPDETDMWWLDQYSPYFGEHATKRNQVYSGAIVAVGTAPEMGSFVIPLGKTHFYIQSFIEIGFGLNLAERIANDRQTKMKALRGFSGRTSKELISYTSGSGLIFAGGETAEYLKLKPQNKELWGNAYVHFGSSVQFNSTAVEPEDIGRLLAQINASIRQRKLFQIPLMKEIADTARIQHLRTELADRILRQDGGIGILDYEIYGVDFVFSQQTHLRLKVGTLKSGQIEHLTLQHVIDFSRENEIDLHSRLFDFRVQVLVDGQSKYTTQLVNLFTCTTDDRTFLFNGKWFYFNETFLEKLHDAINKIIVEQLGTEFSRVEYEEWKALRTEGVKYPEAFVVEKLAEQNGHQIIDRNLDYIQGENKTYSIEVGDIYDSGTQRIYVVKIGEPNDFGYAFDQASTMLNGLHNNIYDCSDGRTFSIKEIILLLIFKTDRVLASPTDTRSIMFELKLNGLLRLAQEKNVTLKIQYSKIL